MTTTAQKFVKGNRYIFGIQVRTFGKTRGKPAAIDHGQTILELISMGE